MGLFVYGFMELPGGWVCAGGYGQLMMMPDAMDMHGWY